MKKLLLFVVLVLGACTTISAQDAVQRFANEFSKTDREIGNLMQTGEEISRLSGRKNVTEKFHHKSGITSKQTDYEAILIGKEIRIDVSLTSIYVESIHGSRLIERTNYGTFTVASNLICGGVKGCWIQIDNNRENTVIRFYCRGRNYTSEVFDTYRVKQYHEKPLNKRYGGVNHRSTYRPKRYH